MTLPFTKMNGAGNDFVMLDNRDLKLALTKEQIEKLCDRHRGIGADGLLCVEPATEGGDFKMRYYNADGGEAEMCGNGARCFARFVFDQGLTDKREIRVETKKGIITPRLEADGNVTVDMGVPVLNPADVPFVSDSDAWVQPLDVGGTVVAITAVSMGNPHAVQVVADVDAAPVAVQGPLIEHHTRFPARVNAGFLQVVDEHRVRLRVFERGAGETLACGTGACAAVVAGILRELVVSPVTVETRGGELTIAWDGIGTPVMMTGPAVTVFSGTLTLP